MMYSFEDSRPSERLEFSRRFQKVLKMLVFWRFLMIIYTFFLEFSIEICYTILIIYQGFICNRILLFFCIEAILSCCYRNYNVEYDGNFNDVILWNEACSKCTVSLDVVVTLSIYLISVVFFDLSAVFFSSQREF